MDLEGTLIDYRIPLNLIILGGTTFIDIQRVKSNKKNIYYQLHNNFIITSCFCCSNELSYCAVWSSELCCTWCFFLWFHIFLLVWNTSSHSVHLLLVTKCMLLWCFFSSFKSRKIFPQSPQNSPSIFLVLAHNHWMFNWKLIIGTLVLNWN